jgi:hypothetical protein
MNKYIREQVLGIVSGLRVEKLAAPVRVVEDAVRGIRTYTGRGGGVRGAVRGAARAAVGLAGGEKQLRELIGKRMADAVTRLRSRPLTNVARQFASSGGLLRSWKARQLDAGLSNLAREGGFGLKGFSPSGFGMAGGTVSSGSLPGAVDIARIKALLAQPYSVRADQKAVADLQQYLGTNSVRSTDVLRNKLRRSSVTNT